MAYILKRDFGSYGFKYWTGEFWSCTKAYAKIYSEPALTFTPEFSTAFEALWEEYPGLTTSATIIKNVVKWLRAEIEKEQGVASRLNDSVLTSFSRTRALIRIEAYVEMLKQLEGN